MTSKDVSELDFDSIKDSFITYLKSQEEFSDFNYEGSNISVLMNLLAYNTYYNAVYNNMTLNETFTDSAAKRSSIVSRGKEIGYTPRSMRAAEMGINIVATNLIPEELAPSMTLVRGTRFRGIDANNANSYYFIVSESITANINNDSFTYSNVVLKEGAFVNFNYVVNKINNPSLLFEIPHENVDTSTLRVRVQDSSSSQIINTYTLAEHVFEADGESLIFFLQENYKGRYEIQFGDGVLGKTLTDGNIVLMDYIVTSGSLANGLSKVIAVDPIGIVPTDRCIITVQSNSSGGSAKEATEALRLNIPYWRSTNNRAVTTEDYIAFLRKEFQFIEAINVWGGEDNDPPIYGKVFLSLKPYDGLFIADFIKQNIIKSLLKNSGVATVSPEFVEPSYLFVSYLIDIKYDQSKTSNSSSEIKVLTAAKVDNYFGRIVKKFNQLFTRSNLLKEILTVDKSIESVILNIYISHRETVIPTTSQGITFSFNNQLTPSSFFSNKITIVLNQVVYDVFIKDKSTDFKSATGILIAVDVHGAIVIDNLGTIDYLTGKVIINVIEIQSTNTPNDYIIFNVKVPENINSIRNQLIVKDDILFGKYENIVSGSKITISEL